MEAPTATQVLGAATERLVANGFVPVQDADLDSGQVLRIFEDPLSVVGLVYFDTWASLEANWSLAQGELVELMSSELSRTDPKTWEGYLLLFTPDEPPGMLAIDQVRRDTSRLRKLVTTGSELSTIAAVDDAMLPVLPLFLDDSVVDTGRILDRLPDLLTASGDIDAELSRLVIGAFQENRSPMEEIWKWRQLQ